MSNQAGHGSAANPGPPNADAHLLQHIRTEIRAESDLLGERLNALLSSQSFLVIAYASSMGAANGRWTGVFPLVLPSVLAVLGLTLVLLAWPGIRAAHAVVERWRERESQLLARAAHLADYTLLSDEDGREQIGERRREGALFAQRAPVAFTLAWCFFVALPMVLYLGGVRT